MSEFLCGLFIGGNVVLLIGAMFVLSRPGKIRMRSGTLVSFYNNKGEQITVELGNDLRENDDYAVVREPESQTKFVVSSHRLS
jgi:hypothetical protein